MRYILDTNCLNGHLIGKTGSRKDVFIIQDVEDEHTSYGSNTSHIRGVEILQVGVKHLRRLQQLLIDEGDNFELIRLYTGLGTADVMILAFVLAEHELPDSLFAETYTIITKDKGLSEAAKKYGIMCQESL